MKAAVLFVLAIILVWFLLAKPDRDAEIQAITQQLSFEADLRSQALADVLEKYRLASVLLVRTGIVEKTLDSEQPGSEVVDRLGYLQALSGVQSIMVVQRGTNKRYPEHPVPERMLRDGTWQAAISQAFHGNLGRGFYTSEFNRPIYVFFVPYFKEGELPAAVIVVSVDLGSLRDIWQVSKNKVELVSNENSLMISNNVVVPANPVQVAREHARLGATLLVSGAPPALVGSWLLRSLITGLMLLIAILLVSRQLERRQLMTELAQQRAGEATRLEKEVAERTRELKAVQDQLVVSEKLALLGQMSASISHEINQPLAALKNYTVVADRMLDKGNTEGARNNLRLMEKLTDRISRIVVNLRSFATNEPSPAIRVIDVVPVIEEALGELYDRFPVLAAHCDFVAACEKQSVFASAGRTRLLQVLINLLTNAWFACRDMSLPSIVISLRELQSHITIVVTDNGPGINSREGETVFEAFVSSRHEGGGLGLGLTISRSFIDSMGGSMTIESASNGGAAILVTLQKPDRPVFVED